MKRFAIVLALSALPSTACKNKSAEKTGGAADDPATAGGPKMVAAPASTGVVRVDGSSTVFLISQAVAEDFQGTDKGLGKITVAESGTGGGFKKFCRGELDVTGASRPIKAEEAEACKQGGIEFIELPVAYDGLAVVVHKDNAFVDKLTVEELKAMWAPESQGKVMSWKQVRPGFPDKPLHLFGPGVDSGTYDYFTQATVGKEHSSRGDYTSSEDDNVLVQGVSTDPGALGFFGLAYYEANTDKLKLVPIDDGKPDNGDGAILPGAETVNNGTYQPLSRPLFIYVSAKALARPDVAKLAEYYLSDKGVALAKEVGYVALPAKISELTRKRLADKKLGSMFSGGSKVNVSLEALLQGRDVILEAAAIVFGRVAPRRSPRASSLGERVIELGLAGCAVLSILVTAGIVMVLAFETVSFFRDVPFREFVGDTRWTPLFASPHFGIWSLISGTLLTAGIAIAVALPFGLLAAIYLSELATRRVRAVVKPTLELLAGVPTIVYGYFALTFVTPMLQRVVPGLSGFNALSPGIVMGIMIIPMISSLAEDALYAVPHSLREGSLALGAGTLPTILRVVVPSAFSGIAAAVTLAVSRAIGETMVVTIAAGQQPNFTFDPRVPIETMTAYIASISKGDVPYGSLAHRALFAVGATLFVMTLVMNLASYRFARRLRRRGGR